MLRSERGTGWRRPRLRVSLSGVAVGGVLQARVSSNNHAAADRFSVRVALREAAGWIDRADMDVAIEAALDDDWTTLVEGAVDQVDIDVGQGVVRLHGRDRSSAMIEQRTRETFANRTASEIAGILAGKHGLAVDAWPTSTPVGRYWQLSHDRLMLDQFSRSVTEWDLLVSLARREGFDVWVTGRTLFFRPPVSVGPAMVLRAPGGVGATVTSMRLDRALTLSGSVEVTVTSWHSRQRSVARHTARASGAGSGVRQYAFVAPNLTPADAQAMAEQRLRTLASHARVINADMPGELSLTPRADVLVEGTGTGFDGRYTVDELERRLDAEGGFTQHVRARQAA